MHFPFGILTKFPFIQMTYIVYTNRKYLIVYAVFGICTIFMTYMYGIYAYYNWYFIKCLYIMYAVKRFIFLLSIQPNVPQEKWPSCKTQNGIWMSHMRSQPTDMCVMYIYLETVLSVTMGNTGDRSHQALQVVITKATVWCCSMENSWQANLVLFGWGHILAVYSVTRIP